MVFESSSHCAMLYCVTCLRETSRLCVTCETSAADNFTIVSPLHLCLRHQHQHPLLSRFCRSTKDDGHSWDCGLCSSHVPLIWNKCWFLPIVWFHHRSWQYWDVPVIAILWNWPMPLHPCWSGSSVCYTPEMLRFSDCRMRVLPQWQTSLYFLHLCGTCVLWIITVVKHDHANCTYRCSMLLLLTV